MKKTLIAVPIVIVLLAVAGAAYRAREVARMREADALMIRVMRSQLRHRSALHTWPAPVGHPGRRHAGPTPP